MFAHDTEKRVDQKASTGKRRKPSRFGNSQDVLVLVEDCKRNGGVRFLPGWATPDQRLTDADYFTGSGGLSVEQDEPRFDPGSPLVGGRMLVASAEVFENGEIGGFRAQCLSIGVALVQAHRITFAR